MQVHSFIVKTFLFHAIRFSETVLIQTIQFRINIDLVQTQLNVKTVQFQKNQFNVSRVLMSKTLLFQTIQFSITTRFKYQNFYFK